MSISVFLNICEYVFNVSSALECPKYFATNVIDAPLFISNDAHECLKSCILICFTFDSLQFKFFFRLFFLLILVWD